MSDEPAKSAESGSMPEAGGGPSAPAVIALDDRSHDDKPDPPAASLEAGGLAPSADPTSSMAARFNIFFRWFSRRFFGHFDLDAKQVERLRALEEKGAVVYVMRYSSRLDYLLFNWLFLRDRLRLSSFANGIVFYYYKPLFTILKQVFTRRRGAPVEIRHSEECSRVRTLVRERGSVFIFLRTRRLRTFLRGVRKQPQRRDELDLLLEVVREATENGTPVSVVPLSIFWRKGPRRESRFLNLDYGSLARPSDLAKVTSFLATYRSLSVKVGDEIDVNGFAASRPDDSPERLARTVRRSILIHLYREEKVVVGPTLRSPQHVLREVLEDRGVRSAMAQWARDRKSSPERAEREVEKMVREIAARMNSTLLALMAGAATLVFRRLFSSFEVTGLEKAVEVAKSDPLVLVPSHRSYFDFLIVSWLFYRNHLVPPHIAARENMAFGPFGLLFRASGAFFLRKSFDDPLYKQVFRAYVAYLVRDGYNQEFFIEGGRSRTGKTLAPRLGMLTWDVDAFLESSRRDLYIVPIAITYERLVEESGMVGELEGEKKTEESMLSLFKARKVLERRFGSVHVHFSEPISLAESLGDRRERFAASVVGEIDQLVSGETDAEGQATDPVLEERRAFIDDLGHRVVERINWSFVVNATSVAAAVLLGSPHRGLRRAELVERVQQMVGLLELQGVACTSALQADVEDF
ncbi:MAG: 1-acyl-sn-glycerol-3-phosphate acyltransferase, partial [Actinomycetota bacterium]|nr:1-acyl-sn-glycerol-3-phosphate acyltransferase [Actinomycetota bacterium]